MTATTLVHISYPVLTDTERSELVVGYLHNEDDAELAASLLDTFDKPGTMKPRRIITHRGDFYGVQLHSQEVTDDLRRMHFLFGLYGIRASFDHRQVVELNDLFPTVTVLYPEVQA